MIGANSGEVKCTRAYCGVLGGFFMTSLPQQVNFYCSTGSNQASGGAAEDDLVLSIREGSDSLLDPEYFWRVQNIKEAVTPERPAGGNRSADDNYEFFEDVGCRDVSLGSPLAGYDIAECEDSCTAQPTCLGFTYSLARAVCYLKATCNTPYKQPREVTAIKKKKNALVRLIPHQAEYQRLDGLVCATRPLGAALRAARQQRCEKMCSARPECEAYSYDASAGSCLLHKACGNDQLSQSSSGASGFKIAAPALDRGTSGYAVFEGVQCSDRSFRGAAPAAVLSILSTLNQRTCEGFCTLQEHCTAYTYSADTRRCTLRGSCRTYALATGTTTGMRPAGHSAPIPPSWPVSFTLLTSAKCAGPSLAVVLSYTADKCALACTTTVSCKAFSFDNAHRCYLMASCDIIQQPDEAFVSGTNLSIEGPTLAPTPEPTPPQTAPPTTCVDSSDANGDGCLGHLLPLPPSDPALYGGWEYLTDDDEVCSSLWAAPTSPETISSRLVNKADNACDRFRPARRGKARNAGAARIRG